MSSQKPLVIDKRDKVKGLYTFCLKCKQLTGSRKCGMTKKRISSCKNTEHHRFRAVVTVPGTNGTKRKKKILEARTLKDAIVEKLEFESELKSNNYQNTDKHILPKEVKPTLLIECMAMYIGYLNNEGVEAHMMKVRSSKHLWEVENYFVKFSRCLKAKGVDVELFKIEELNDRCVALFHSYILEELKHSNKTYNKMMSLFRQFVDWLIHKRGYDVPNPFTSVQRLRENRDKTVLTAKEFKVFLSVIKSENGIKELPSGERKNQYREWLVLCFKLALETGLRREEFMNLKFSDIVCDEHGKPRFIEVENYKVNRMRGGDRISQQKKYVPITKGLLLLLDELQFEEYKGSEVFIVGRKEKANRNTLIDFVSKSFSHFWKQTGSDKNVQLKHLRKTYLTALVEHFGDKAPMISDHSGIEVLKKHYVNDQQLASATNNFAVFK